MMEANLRVFTSIACQLPPAHIFNIAWIAQQRSLHEVSCIHGKRLVVSATSSSVPWRNAQPTSPLTAPAELPADPSSSLSNSSNAATTQLPKVKDLVGYTAVLSIKAVNKQEDRVLGIVKEVIGSSESGLGHPLLKVVSQTTSNLLTLTTATSTDATTSPPPPTAPSIFQVEHLIPLVRNIVPRIDPSTRRLLVDPPSGLLDLGKRRALLQHLKNEITRFIMKQEQEQTEQQQTLGLSNSKPNGDYNNEGGSTSLSTSALNMPLRRELEASGRKDLVKLIKSAGGFIEVAQDLGFRPVRRPPGYWEDEEALDRELSLFVAANWVRFEEDSDTEELESAAFSNPQQNIDTATLNEEDQEENERYKEIEGNDDGGGGDGLFFSDQFDGDERQQQQDKLGKGIEVYWYNQVTRKVRWSAPVLPQTVALDDEGSTLLTDSPDDRAMPSRSALFAAGRYDLHQAIVAAGGYGQVSEDLERYPAWPPSRHLRSFRALAAELRDFADETGLLKNKMPTRGELLSMGRSDLHQAITKLGGYPTVARKLRLKSQRKKRGEWKNIEAVVVEVKKFSEEKNRKERGRVLRMPTHEELRAAGRHDLRHALQQHGSAEVARLAGLEVARNTGLGSGKQRQKRLEEIAAEIQGAAANIARFGAEVK